MKKKVINYLAKFTHFFKNKRRIEINNQILAVSIEYVPDVKEESAVLEFRLNLLQMIHLFKYKGWTLVTTQMISIKVELLCSLENDYIWTKV